MQVRISIKRRRVVYIIIQLLCKTELFYSWMGMALCFSLGHLEVCC